VKGTAEYLRETSANANWGPTPNWFGRDGAVYGRPVGICKVQTTHWSTASIGNPAQIALFFLIVGILESTWCLVGQFHLCERRVNSGL
jgi:hypothetical protein